MTTPHSPRSIRAALDRGTSVVISGPAGIGKSTLAAQVVSGRPAVVAQCLAAFRPLSLRPLSHALSVALAGTADEVATAVALGLGDRLLLVEDLHWADDATREVLDRLLVRVPVLITTRELPKDLPGTALAVTVPPLPEGEATELAAMLHPELGAEELQRLIGLAGGNPLLIHHLAAHGNVSPTFEAALEARVADLPVSVAGAIGRLAVHGAPAPADLIGWPVTDEAVELVRHHDGLIWFAHERLAGVVLAAIEANAIKMMRTELAARSAPVDAARHHLELGNLDEVAHFARIAARDADPAERADLLSMAVSALGDRVPPELRLEAATAMIDAHRPAEARVLLSSIEDDPGLAAEIGLQLARAAWLEGEATTAIEHAERALALVAGSGTAVEARLAVERAAIRVRVQVGDPTIIELADEALALATRHDVDRARALNVAGLARSHTGRPGWDEYFRAAADAARESGDIDEQLAASYWLISALGFYGPMLSAIEIGASMLDEARRLGRTLWYHHYLGAHIVHLAARGDIPDSRLDEARRMLADAPTFRNRAQVELALVAGLLDAGDPAAATEVVFDAVEMLRNDEDRALNACTRAEIALATRDEPMMDAAIADLMALTRGFFGLNALGESAAIHLALSDPHRQRLPAFTHRLTPVLDVVAIERTAYEDRLGGRHIEAVDGLLAAADEWDRRGLHRFARRAAAGAVEVAHAVGEFDLAIRLADDALSRFARFNPVSDVSTRRIAWLRRSAARSRLTRLLTARELEVMMLVVGGLTSRQIAERLGITTHTVESHVGDALRRLGCRTRRQAVALLR